MKQVSVTLSTYTADVSGVCSALYELGGMVVIHDPYPWQARLRSYVLALV